jgi:tetratricopeptide (TPR) repeat protein
MNNLAVRYRELNDLDQALECAREALAQAQYMNARDVEAAAQSTLASIYLRLGDVEAAVLAAKRAEELAQGDDDLARVDAWVVLATAAENRGQHDEADALYHRALTVLKQHNHHAVYADTALAYSFLLRRRGDIERALDYAVQAATAKASRSA